MKKTMNARHELLLAGLALVLVGLIVCPVVSIFAKAVIYDGRLDFYHAWQTIAKSENVRMIVNSMLLGVAVVALSTVIAAPLAYLFSRTKFAGYRAFDIVFMIPFMTPPYIASMGWILFMQKKGLLQQLLPITAGAEKLFFTFGGLVLVMSLHVFPFMLTILPLYNTLGIMVLAYVALFLPYTVQYVTSSFTQISDSLLAAGRVFGGKPLYNLWHITLPLIRPGIVTGWMMTFIIAFRELVTASLIAPPNTLVVSTYIVREFEQGSVSVGMAMAVLCVVSTTTALLALNTVIDRNTKES